MSTEQRAQTSPAISQTEAGASLLELASQYMLLDKETREFVDRRLDAIKNERDDDRELEREGVRLAFAIAIAFLAAATLLTMTGHEVAGVILGTVDLVALVAVFIHGRQAP